ncbi:alkaline phosphatase D family protein [Noviherbaspirillum sedimenti]|nr:alkaline phosphatase D family protein [Noviherbaspirillum sedimenti]
MPAPTPDTQAPADITFSHSVASGDPLSDRVILWTRITTTSPAAVAVDFVVATDSALGQIVRSGQVASDLSRDRTVKIDVDGLQENTTYYYRFSAGGVTSPVGRTKTLPAGEAGRVRMAVVSCASLAHGFFNAYRRISERADLDLVVHLGDYIYEHGSGEFGNIRPYEPPNEILSLSDYRTRYAQYRRDPDLQELHRQHPMVAIWDDHEIANNAHANGAQNHTEATEGPWAARVAAALQAYYEWMPIRVIDPANLRKSNRTFALGNLADLLMLEERVNARSMQLSDDSFISPFTQSGAYTDPSRQMLGVEEESWLSEKLRSSTAKWKLIGQGTMFAQIKVRPEKNADGGGIFINADQWDGYQPARDRVYDILNGDATNPAIGNVVFLSGDLHSSWAADLSQDPNNSDVNSGGYDPDTGAGARAVEFVGTSITSPALDELEAEAAVGLEFINPHFKYIELSKRGYMLLDVDPNRVIGEWWYVDTVANVSNVESFGRALQVQDGTSHLISAAQTLPRLNPPALAP